MYKTSKYGVTASVSEKYGIQVPLHPGSFMNQTGQPNLQDKLPDDVKYSQWKRERQTMLQEL